MDVELATENFGQISVETKLQENYLQRVRY